MRVTCRFKKILPGVFLRLAMVLGAVLPAASASADVQPATPLPPAEAEAWTEARAFADSGSPLPKLRVAATVALAGVPTWAARERLLLLAQADVDPGVRVAAVQALASRRDPTLEPILKMVAARDPAPQVRAAAAHAAVLVAAFGKRPATAAGFSLLCPGCGYFYLRQPLRAGAYLGTTAALLGAAVALVGDDGARLELGTRGGGPNTTPTTAPLAIPLLIGAQNLWFYGVFGAYRDARLARGDAGYTYPITREGLDDLVTAPFRPRVLARPWFWAGLPLLLGAAVGFTALVDRDDLGGGMRRLGDPGGVWFLGRRFGTKTGFALGEAYYGSLFLPVGVGEEALFRGALQPGMTETFGLWPGWAITSGIFGGVHAFNFLGQDQGLTLAAKAVPFITVVGSYLGVVAIRTGYTLETSVALHFWYDFFLGTISFIADPDNQPFALRFGMPF